MNRIYNVREARNQENFEAERCTIHGVNGENEWKVLEARFGLSLR